MKRRDVLLLACAIVFLLASLRVIAATEGATDSVAQWAMAAAIGVAVMVMAWLLTKLRFR